MKKLFFIKIIGFVLFFSIFILVQKDLVINEKLEVFNEENLKKELDKKTSTQIKTQKIIMAWDMVYDKRKDFSRANKIKGLDVISPTWFQIDSKEGEFVDRAYKEYMEWANDNNYKVWALFNNDFNNQKMTSEFLNNQEARKKLIDKLIKRFVDLKIHGINLDFEMVPEKNSKQLISFIKEISKVFKENNIIISLDVHVPDAFDRTITREGLQEIEKFVDYIIMMGYDQHWSGSTKPGSVGQVSWVDRNIQKLIDMGISENKIILGVPFYTRLWEEGIDKKGKNKLKSSKILTIKAAYNHINGIKKEILSSTWDLDSGQNYMTYTKNSSNYKIWMEDKDSMNIRTSLVLKYNLAGISAWSLGFETQDIWEIINYNLKELKTFDKWNYINQELVLNN